MKIDGWYWSTYSNSQILSRQEHSIYSKVQVFHSTILSYKVVNVHNMLSHGDTP